MWYPLLMAAVVLICLLVLRKLPQHAWLAGPRTAPSERPFLWKYEVNKKAKPVASRIGITAASPYTFVIEKGEPLHTLSSALGFCRVCPHSTTPLYVLSDSPALLAALKENPAVVQAIEQAFAAGLLAIRANGAQLVARLERLTPNPLTVDVDTILNGLLALKPLLAATKKAPRFSPRKGLQLFCNRLPVMLWVATFLTLSANVLLGFQIIEWEPLLPLALCCCALWLVAGSLLLWCAFRATSSSHLMLRRFVRYSSWGGCLYIVVLLWFINCQYDTSTAEERTLPVLEKYTPISRKTKTYHVRIADWTAHTQNITVQISEPMYEKLQPGDDVRILSRAGLLGMQWIAKVEQKKAL